MTGACISEARLNELEAVLTDAETDQALRALILTGKGDRVFCVGLDPLDYFQAIVTRVSKIIARLEDRPPERT